MTPSQPRCDECTLNHSIVVPGWGSDRGYDLAIVGEAPGAEEVRQGRPFVGRAGKLLRRILAKLEYDLERIWWTNACQCRPPENRDPNAKEISACNDRLLSELKDKQPRLVVPVGNAGTVAILGQGGGITRRRGIYQELNHNGHLLRVLPTLHPAGVLRFPGAFPDLAADLDLARRILAGERPLVEPPYQNYVMIHTREGFHRLLKRLREVGWAAVDIETSGLNYLADDILSIGFSWREGTACVVDWQEVVRPSRANLIALSNVLGQIRCSFHNGQFDVQFLRREGIEVNFRFDTMLSSYLLDERRGVHSLERLAISRYQAPDYETQLRREYGIGAVDDEGIQATYAAIPKEELMPYNGADADYTARLTLDLASELMAEGLRVVHDDILLPAAEHFMEQQRLGMLVDVAYHDKLGRRWQQDMADLEVKMKSRPGAEGINLRSPKQVSHFLFSAVSDGGLGLNKMANLQEKPIDPQDLLVEIQKITDAEAQEFWRSSSSVAFRDMKATSTSAYALWWLAQQDPWPRLLLEHRILAKKWGTYYKGIREVMWPDGRIRPRIRLHGTRTGRVSSTEPNIHATPRLAEIKNIYIADPGHTLVLADYSQAEVRMMAHYAGDDHLISLLHTDDIHMRVCCELFGLSEEEYADLPKGERELKRRAAKTIVFGLIYGRSPKGLAPQLGVSLEEAQRYIEKFFKMMPNVRKWIGQQWVKVMKEHEVSSIYGRKRRFPFIPDGMGAGEVKRQAVNMPIQSAVSDMTLLAYIRATKKLREAGIHALPWVHVHDAFIVQVPKGTEEEAIGLITETMSDVGFETKVPFPVEISLGERWGEVEVILGGQKA